MVDEGGQLAWRETYFIMFSAGDRPTIAQVEAAIIEAGSRLTISNLQADEDGLFASAVVQAPEDNAAMEISYESGEAVVEQSTELAQQLRKQVEGDQLARLIQADARLDVMHFERLPDSLGDADDTGEEFDFDEESDDLLNEALDPASLITVVDALTKVTRGLAFDPASGDIMA